MSAFLRDHLCGFLVLLCAGLYGQFPAYTSEVIDLNTEASLRSNFSLSHFYPAEREGSFFFKFDYGSPSSLYYFDGAKLDTPLLDATINGRILGRYAGGYLIGRNDGTAESTLTSHFDPVTYRTIPLLNTYLEPLHAFPDGRRLLSAGNILYAIGDTPGSLTELPLWLSYRADGSAPLGDRFVYFTTNGLASTDGTVAGTRMLYNSRSDLSDFTVVDGRLYFLNSDREIITSDGSPEGTRKVDFDSIPQDRRPEYAYTGLQATRNAVTFLGKLPDGRTQVWRTDGSATGTYALGDLSAAYPEGNGDLLLFRSGPVTSREVWVTAGSRETTRKLLELSAGKIDNEDWAAYPIGTLADGSLYFRTNESYTDRSFYLLKPTGELSRIEVPDIVGGYGPKYIATATQFFVAYDGGRRGLYVHRPQDTVLTFLAPFERLTNYLELSDGGIIAMGEGESFAKDKEVTVVVYGDRTEVLAGHLSTYVNSNGTLAMVQASDQVFGIGVVEGAGESIFKYDLLTSRTTVLQDLYPDTKSSDVNDLIAGDGAAFFVHDETVYGTSAGCKYESLFPLGLFGLLRVTPLPGTGLSLISAGRNDDSYYLSDGTRAGTRNIGKLDFQPASPVQAFEESFYYLSVIDGPPNGKGRLSLVRLDTGSGKASEIAGVITPAGAVPQRFVTTPSLASSGTAIYFPWYSSTGWEVWRSDGTPAGTKKFTELPRQLDLVFPSEFTGSDGVVSYNLRKLGKPNELGVPHYIAEGATAATKMDNAVDAFSWTAAVRISSTVYFANQGTIFSQTVGSQTSKPVVTLPVVEIRELTVIDDNTLIFTAGEYNNNDLWKAQLSSGTLTRLAEALTIRPSSPSSQLTVIDSVVLIALRDGIFYQDLAMINVHSGDVVRPDINDFLDHVSEIVSTGDRFLYINEGWVYGQEVYVINFGSHEVNKTTATRSPKITGLGLRVYPNPLPAGTQLTIELPEDGSYTYRLTTVAGQTLRTGSFTGRGSRLAIDRPVPGAYVLRVWSADNRYGTVRVVVTGS